MNLRNRPTADLVVIFLAGIIGFVIITGVIGALVLALVRPGVNPVSIVNLIGDVTNTLIGAVVGFIAGRNVPQHGKEEDPDE